MHPPEGKAAEDSGTLTATQLAEPQRASAGRGLSKRAVVKPVHQKGPCDWSGSGAAAAGHGGIEPNVN